MMQFETHATIVEPSSSSDEERLFEGSAPAILTPMRRGPNSGGSVVSPRPLHSAGSHVASSRFNGALNVPEILDSPKRERAASEGTNQYAKHSLSPREIKFAPDEKPPSDARPIKTQKHISIEEPGDDKSGKNAFSSSLPDGIQRSRGSSLSPEVSRPLSKSNDATPTRLNSPPETSSGESTPTKRRWNHLRRTSSSDKAKTRVARDIIDVIPEHSDSDREKDKEKEKGKEKEKEKKEKKDKKKEKKEEKEKEKDKEKANKRLAFLSRVGRNGKGHNRGKSISDNNIPRTITKRDSERTLQKHPSQLGLMISEELSNKVKRAEAIDEEPAMAPTRARGHQPYSFTREDLQRRIKEVWADESNNSLSFDPLRRANEQQSAAGEGEGEGEADKPMQHSFEGPDLAAQDPEDTILWNSQRAAEQTDKYRAFAKTVSTYPRIMAVPGLKQGDPICDCYSLQCFDNGTIFCVCDGCGWGNSAKTAAYTVRKVFTETLSNFFSDGNPKSIWDCGVALLTTLAQSHNGIIEGKEVWECGTTTVIAGVIGDLSRNSKPFSKKGLMMVSIGDCKLYHYSRRTGEVRDLTFGNRSDILNPNDCGGRVGPTLGEDASLPDLRNLKLNFGLVEQDDLVWVVSDGVHDNIDPHFMGIPPCEVAREIGYQGGLEGVQSWDDKSLSADVIATLKNTYSMRLLKRMLFSGNYQYTARHPSEEGAESGELDAPVISSISPDAAVNPQPTTPDSTRRKARKGKKNQIARKDGASSSTGSEMDGDAGSEFDSDGEKQPGEEEEEPEKERDIDADHELHSARGGKDSKLRDGGATPVTITRALIEHSVRQTEAMRTFMEQNPDKRQPADYRLYPGKMDHTTCLSFRV